MRETLRKTLAILTPHERRRGLLLLGMVMVMATFEVVGVASVMPFLAVLGNPSVIQNQPVLATAYDWLGMTSTQQFLMWLGVAAFVLIAVSAAVRVVTYYYMNRFVQMRRHSLGERLLETYLRQPYAFFLNRHTSDMSKAILSEVDQVIANVFLPGVMALAYGVVALAMVVLLVVVDPLIALAVAIIMGGLYLLIFKSVAAFLLRIGGERARANRQRFTNAGEALAGIKDIKLLGREYAYLTRFRTASSRFSRHVATSNTLSMVPRFLVEAVAFGGVILLSVVLMATRGDISTVLPILGLYAFAGYKLLPAMQHIYNGASKIQFGASAVNDLYEDLHRRTELEDIPRSALTPFDLQDSIQLSNVGFSYPNGPSPALSDINIRIPVGAAVGLVGGTGAGKTTLVDLLLGLLRPSQGELQVDGAPITDGNLRRWQRTLGYVPQDIFLSDSTVAENIALGVSADQVDHAQVERCARMAQVHSFIKEELPEGYATEVGERGVRLSGGQRQRLGIARALYHDPEVLVFDEATSALDTVTEKAVMEAIDGLAHKKTIILIAHRLSTVRNCDKIILLDKGKVQAEGTFTELQQGSDRFRAMASATTA